MVLEAVYKGILTKDGATIFYASDVVGYDLIEAAEYFDKPENQQLKLKILAKLDV